MIAGFDGNLTFVILRLLKDLDGELTFVILSLSKDPPREDFGFNKAASARARILRQAQDDRKKRPAYAERS
ncbi:MAG: hypothetical protein IJJ25_03655 [Lachnospiraceae bacterium]|nr:hypothetical protein [Lachnospiraceae bacterium]